MHLILIRHAEAGDRDPATYPDDDLRALTPGGASKMSAVARAMKAMGIRFDYLVTSPLLRARETAAILGDVYGLAEAAQVSDALGPACTPLAVTRLLSKFPPDARVALVGHEPAFSAVAAAMISTSGDTQLELKKGGSIGIRFDSAAQLGKGTLEFHLRAGQLKRVLKAES